MNGQLLRLGQATLNVTSYGLHYGAGVFEGMRSYGTAEGPSVFRMDAHLERFRASAAVYGMRIPYGTYELAEAVGEVIALNGLTDSYIRPICYLGSESLGVRADCPVEVAIIAWASVFHVRPEVRARGARVTVSPWVKFSSNMMPATAKACGQYINSRLALSEASSRGFDEALVLNADGNIAEGAVENVFILSGRTLRTNDERSSILMGITRDSIIEIARALGYQVEIGALTLEDLLRADEAFFTGTAVEVLPIREVDGQLIGGPSPGPVTRIIQRAYYDAVSGRDPAHKHWLHLVGRSAYHAVT